MTNRNRHVRESKKPSKDPRKEKMCTSKEQFLTRKKAEEQKNMRPYKCPYCKRWHRTSK